MDPYGTSYGYRLQRFQPLAVTGYKLQISVGTLALAAEALVGFLPWRGGGSVWGTVKKRPNRTFVENPKYQDYTTHGSVLYIYIWYSNLMCVHMTGKSG